MPQWYSTDSTPGSAATTEEPTRSAFERLVAAWADAPVANVETLAMLLELAVVQVWAFAPESTPADDYTGTLDEDGYIPVDLAGDVPARLVYAQLQQATDLWNAGRVDSNGSDGMDGFTFTPRPMDKTTRSIIRPRRGTFDV